MTNRTTQATQTFMIKNKTLAAWLSFVGGPLGLHRFYLHGFGDLLGWFLPIPTALGIYGVERIKQFGVDDSLSWVLIPLLGFTIAGCALTAILYGLMEPERWNAKFNPQTTVSGIANGPGNAGNTNWLTIGAIIFSLLIGATSLIASIAYSFQGYFEHQIEESKKISQ